MTTFLPRPAVGVLACLVLALNTLVMTALLIPASLVKLLVGSPAVRRRIDPLLNGVATTWIAVNGAIARWTQQSRWDVAGTESLRRDRWYMVTSNHQSWADIFVLQGVLGRRIPLLKFSLKQSLIYVPVIGLAWWALDFPFMKRHSRATLQKNPQLRDQDLEATRLACRKFALVPTSVMTFPEGTRFSAAKRAAQGGNHQHLLKPKSGGLATSIETLGEKFSSLIDVTIVYPDGVPSFWDYMCGRCGRIIVRVHEHPIPPEFREAGNASRSRVHRWLDAIWEEKDREIGQLQAAPRGAAPSGAPLPAGVDSTGAPT